MIKFKGRCGFRQYFAMNPIKRKYETGYSSEFQIYTGRTTNTAETNLGSRVVKDYTRNILGKYQMYSSIMNSILRYYNESYYEMDIRLWDCKKKSEIFAYRI